MHNTQKTILVVEDERSVRDILVDALGGEGFSVKEARNGQEGLVEVEAAAPDLILLDLVMPKMDGREMLKGLAKSEQGRSVPVILLTNLNELDDMAKIVSQPQVTDYVVKSDWHIKDVVARVKERLK